VAGFENSLKTAALAVLKRDLTESERVEFLELAAAIGMSNVEDYLYMLMVFKRNEDRVNGAISKFSEITTTRFDEMGALEQKIHDTLKSSISKVLNDDAHEISYEMGKRIAEAAKENLKAHEDYHYERGQMLVVGFVVAVSTVAYWLGSQFGFEPIDNATFVKYVFNLPVGAVIVITAFGFAGLWSLDHWKQIKRDGFYKTRFVLQILLLVALLLTLLR
jgi:hypothetical protein